MRLSPLRLQHNVSITEAGTEDRLHNYEVNGVHASIESELNTVIETPFSRSST